MASNLVPLIATGDPLEISSSSKQLLQWLDLDAYVLLSLFCQFFLFFAAPMRKSTDKRMLPLIWLPYVYGIYFANYSIGMIPDNGVEGGRTGGLRVFWAPFLILHLGGPNSITAVTLADNELWLRYAAHLITLSYTFVRVFLRSFLKNDLWIPTLIMYVAALLKYIERIVCLFNARLTKFRDSTLPKPNPGVNYAKLMETYDMFKESNLASEFEYSYAVPRHLIDCQQRGKLGEIQIVKRGYMFFNIFQGLFMNSMYSYTTREKSMEYFQGVSAADAFRICQVELNLAYDLVYTKFILINMMNWPFHNLVSLILQLTSLSLWICIDKTTFKGSSVNVTKILLGGSIALELLSLFEFLMSDWLIARVGQRFSALYETFFLFKQRIHKKMDGIWYFRIYGTLFRRWSESIPQGCLLVTSVNARRIQQRLFILRGDRLLARISALFSVHHQRFTDELGDFIFKELLCRSLLAKRPKDVEEISFARGSWTLATLSGELEAKFRPWITDVGYEESLILWHIATDICDSSDVPQKDDSHRRKFSKIISGYMIHLLIVNRVMLPRSSQILGQIIYGDTLAESMSFLGRVPWAGSKQQILKQACDKLYGVVMEEDDQFVAQPRQIKGDKSRSVLFDACFLAKKLEELEETKKWKVISKVWAEMLFFCATQCSPSVHLETLGTGGGLLTLVWLLMTHLGLGKQFRYKKGRDTRAHLVVGAERN